MKEVFLLKIPLRWQSPEVRGIPFIGPCSGIYPKGVLRRLLIIIIFILIITLFNGSNFLMGIDNQLFAVSNMGGVWQFTSSWNKIGTFPEAMEEVPVVFSINSKGYCMGKKSHLWEYEPGEIYGSEKKMCLTISKMPG
jgi:hypothetical protein